MNTSIRTWVAGVSLLVALAPMAQAQPAQAGWPTGPVRFVVPFPAGSAPDVLIRFVGVKLTEKWGQSVIVDNRPGGSGVIGMNANGFRRSPAGVMLTCNWQENSAVSVRARSRCGDRVATLLPFLSAPRRPVRGCSHRSARAAAQFIE